MPIDFIWKKSAEVSWNYRNCKWKYSWLGGNSIGIVSIELKQRNFFTYMILMYKTSSLQIPVINPSEKSVELDQAKMSEIEPPKDHSKWLHLARDSGQKSSHIKLFQWNKIMYLIGLNYYCTCMLLLLPLHHPCCQPSTPFASPTSLATSPAAPATSSTAAAPHRPATTPIRLKTN